MNFKLLPSFLLVIVFIPAFGGGELSDATGLVNRFDIETGGHVFEITTTSNFDIQDIEFDKDNKALTLHMFNSLENNLGEIIIPKNFLSGNFTFYLNDKEFVPKIQSNERIAFITLNFKGTGENKLDIIATNYLEDLDERSLKEDDEIEQDQQSSEGGGCLIATAVFDSELAPEVQHLRELRDNKLLQTRSGFYFISSFNSFYYTFSPQIADLERESPFFREIVKIAITPLLLSLSVLDDVGMDSEIEVVGFGIGIILMNLGMYFAVPTIIVMRIFKK